VGRLLLSVPFVTGRKPVSNPSERGVHGWAKLDWVTEWFLGLKVNSTMSPTAAVMLLGLKMRPAVALLTSICQVAAEAEEAYRAIPLNNA